MNMAGLHRFVEWRVYLLIAVSALLAHTQSQDIGTVPVVGLQRGKQGVVPCPWRGNHGDLDIITWMKQVSEETAEVLVNLDIGGGGMRSGSGYDDGTHNISADFSLVINYVEIDDEGLYACKVALGSGETVQNYTDVSVYAPPSEPYPRAEDCKFEGGSTDSCTIYTSNQDTRNVTCYALEYYPSLTLSFTQAARAIQPINAQEVTNIGGTKSMNITIRAETSEEPYVCKASGIPGQGQEDRVLEILVKKTTPSQPESAKDIILIVLLSLLGVVVLIAAGCMVWRYCSRKNSYRGVPKEDKQDPEKATESSGELKASSLEVVEEDTIELHEVIPERSPAPMAPGSAVTFPEEDLKEFANHLTGRHCRRLKEELGEKLGASGAKSIDNVIRENSVVLFDTDQLLKDWHGRQIGNHSDRRKKLEQTAQKIGREDLKDPKCIDDDELHQLVALLDSDSLKSNVCEILGVKYSYEDKDEEFFQKLCEWRRGAVDVASPLSVAERYRRLMTAFKNINVSKSSSFPFKRHIDESRELYEISCQLLLHDVRPLTRALGITDTDLDRYNRPYQESNGNAGTMCLMKGLYEREGRNWEKMCKVLKNMGYYQAAQMALSGNYRVE